MLAGYLALAGNCVQSHNTYNYDYHHYIVVVIIIIIITAIINNNVIITYA